MKKWIILITVFAVFILLSVIVLTNPIMQQEENTLMVLKGIASVILAPDDICLYDTVDDINYYISKSKHGNEPLIEMMKKDDWIFKDQMGAGMFFEKDDKTKIAAGRHFTRFFRIWIVSINT